MRINLWHAARPSGRKLLASAMALGLYAMQPARADEAPAAQAAPPAMEPKAIATLRAACDALSAAKTMSFTAVNTYERAARNGQPLYYAVKNEVALQRPDKLRVITPGDGIPDEFYYDGKTITAYVPSANLAAVADAPPTIDAMLDAAWDIGAIYFPFADVIVADPCAVFDKNLKSAFYVGQSHVVGDTTTDIVAVAGDGVQGELWIGAQDHLPRQVRVIYTDEPGQAHYQTDYSDWRIGDTIGADTFVSTKAAAAAHMPFSAPAANEAPPRAGEAGGKQP
jgi:hypothetical protein